VACHESTNTTHRYVEANPEMKEKALARLEAPDIRLKRFRASDDLMKFLQACDYAKRRDLQHGRRHSGQPCRARRIYA
jgi:hypothetical protein